MATVDYVYSDFDMELIRQTDGDITKDIDFESIKNSLINIITTKRGSRRMIPTFGIDVDRLLFEPIDDITARKIGREIYDQITKWEKRCVIDNVHLVPDLKNLMYTVTIHFTIQNINRSTSNSITFILRQV